MLDDQIHPRDITSTIVDLAVRGYLKIEETDDKGLVFHHKDYIFHLLQTSAHGPAAVSRRTNASCSKISLWETSQTRASPA